MTAPDVRQAAREAAADLMTEMIGGIRLVSGKPELAGLVQSIREGERDDHPFVRAILAAVQRARREALEEAALVSGWHIDNLIGAIAYRRALKGTPDA